MPTPIGHSIIGLGVALALSPGRRLSDVWRDRATLTLVIVLVNLADLDLLLGLFAFGDPHRFHGRLTHGMLFAVVVACAVALLPGRDRTVWKRFVLGLALLLSHPLADALQSPRGLGLGVGPGVELFAPLSHERFSWPVILLLGVRTRTWEQVLSWHNVRVVALELLGLLPLLLLVDWLKGRWARRSAPSTITGGARS